MVGIKKLGCLGVLSRKTSKNPQKDESYQEGFRTDPYVSTIVVMRGTRLAKGGFFESLSPCVS